MPRERLMLRGLDEGVVGSVSEPPWDPVGGQVCFLISSKAPLSNLTLPWPELNKNITWFSWICKECHFLYGIFLGLTCGQLSLLHNELMLLVRQQPDVLAELRPFPPAEGLCFEVGHHDWPVPLHRNDLCDVAEVTPEALILLEIHSKLDYGERIQAPRKPVSYLFCSQKVVEKSIPIPKSRSNTWILEIWP